MVRGVSEWNLFWFLELRGFGTVSNGLHHLCHVCLSGELLWRVEDLCMHPQLVTSCDALLPSVMIESLRRRSANGERGSKALLLSLVWL